jgi:hypothetical protein
MLRVMILLACAAVVARAQAIDLNRPPLVNCLSRSFTPASGICKDIDMFSKSCWPSAKCDEGAKVTPGFLDLDGKRECDSKEVRVTLCCQCEARMSMTLGLCNVIDAATVPLGGLTRRMCRCLMASKRCERIWKL